MNAINKIIFVLFITAMAPGMKAQVGGLTQTGDMLVCQNSTEMYGVIQTAGSTYSWSIIAGSGGAGTINPGSAPNNLISVTWTSIGTCTLQVIETAGSCSGQPVNIQVTVLPELIPGTASADQIIIAGAIPAPLNSTAPTGGNGTYTYQWESSVDNGATWQIVAGATNLNYAPGALTQTTLFRLIQNSAAGCGSATTNVVTINVQNQIIAGIATADQTICYNSTPAPIQSTPPTGVTGSFTYQWESSIDGGINWVPVTGATNLTWTPGALTQTTLYHLIQTSGAGYGSATTNVVTLTVQPPVITSPIWHN